MKRFSLIALLLVLGIGLWAYRGYQKNLLEQEDAEIWSNVKASTAASEKWNADTNETPAKLPAMRELAIKDGPVVEEAHRRITQAQGWLVQKDSTCSRKLSLPRIDDQFLHAERRDRSYPG